MQIAQTVPNFATPFFNFTFINFQINAHEVSFSSPHFMAIYELACLLEHNCSANCYKTYTSKGEIQIIAGKSIEKNEHLSICYTNFRWTTLGRRRHLNSTKFLSCTCKRCLDVTEFGTNFSALKCQNESALTFSFKTKNILRPFQRLQRNLATRYIFGGRVPVVLQQMPEYNSCRRCQQNNKGSRQRRKDHRKNNDGLQNVFGKTRKDVT